MKRNFLSNKCPPHLKWHRLVCSAEEGYHEPEDTEILLLSLCITLAGSTHRAFSMQLIDLVRVLQLGKYDS